MATWCLLSEGTSTHTFTFCAAWPHSQDNTFTVCHNCKCHWKFSTCCKHTPYVNSHCITAKPTSTAQCVVRNAIQCQKSPGCDDFGFWDLCAFLWVHYPHGVRARGTWLYEKHILSVLTIPVMMIDGVWRAYPQLHMVQRNISPNGGLWRQIEGTSAHTFMYVPHNPFLMLDFYGAPI